MYCSWTCDYLSCLVEPWYQGTEPNRIYDRLKLVWLAKIPNKTIKVTQKYQKESVDSFQERKTLIVSLNINEVIFPHHGSTVPFPSEASFSARNSNFSSHTQIVTFLPLSHSLHHSYGKVQKNLGYIHSCANSALIYNSVIASSTEIAVKKLLRTSKTLQKSPQNNILSPLTNRVDYLPPTESIQRIDEKSRSNGSALVKDSVSWEYRS